MKHHLATGETRLSVRSRFVDSQRQQAPVPERTGASDSGHRNRVFLPLGYEPGYDYPLLVWLPGTDAGRFDLGRTMARLSLRNYLAVQADLAGGAEGCFQAVERMVDRYSVHSRRIYLIGTGDGGTAAFRIACRQATAFAGVISVGGRFPLGEGLFGRLSDIRTLPMLLCCTTGSLADSAPMQHDIDRTLRLFHAAGGLFGLRVYPELAGARWRPAASRAVLHDVDRWIMDEVCRIPANEATAIV